MNSNGNISLFYNINKENIKKYREINNFMKIAENIVEEIEKKLGR